MMHNWNQIQSLPSRKYTCGYCGQPLSSEKGWVVPIPGTHSQSGWIYVCHNCTRPAFFDMSTNKQTPGFSFGEPVQNVADKALSEIYEEARTATSAGCHTAAVLCCRKLLMHLAVAKGAKVGDTFKNYVDFLANGNHIPVACKSWVEQIRDTGNEANHEIKMMKREDAEDLISFCEMLLKITYEFPAVALARTTARTTT